MKYFTARFPRLSKTSDKNVMFTCYVLCAFYLKRILAIEVTSFSHVVVLSDSVFSFERNYVLRRWQSKTLK